MVIQPCLAVGKLVWSGSLKRKTSLLYWRCLAVAGKHWKGELSEVVHLDVVEPEAIGKTFIKHYMVTKEETIVDFEIRPKRGDG